MYKKTRLLFTVEAATIPHRLLPALKVMFVDWKNIFKNKKHVFKVRCKFCITWGQQTTVLPRCLKATQGSDWAAERGGGGGRKWNKFLAVAEMEREEERDVTSEPTRREDPQKTNPKKWTWRPQCAKFSNEVVSWRWPSGFRTVVVKRKEDVPAACSSSKHAILKQC